MQAKSGLRAYDGHNIYVVFTMTTIV